MKKEPVEFDGVKSHRDLFMLAQNTICEGCESARGKNSEFEGECKRYGIWAQKAYASRGVCAKNLRGYLERTA